MNSWWDDIGRQVKNLLRAVADEARGDGYLPMLRPIAPFNQPSFLAPVVTVAGLVSMMLLSGVAATAFGLLLVALLAIYLVLVQVFGVSIELNPVVFGR
jgi:hypothetical protein